MRIRYLQFNPDDGFIMENHPSPYHPERQPPRDEVSWAPVPPQLKLQGFKGRVKRRCTAATGDGLNSV